MGTIAKFAAGGFEDTVFPKSRWEREGDLSGLAGFAAFAGSATRVQHTPISGFLEVWFSGVVGKAGIPVVGNPPVAVGSVVSVHGSRVDAVDDFVGLEVLGSAALRYPK